MVCQMSQHGKGTTKHAIYLRCSTDDQAERDYTTIDTQREINRKHVVALGGVIVKEYADEGKSGTNLKRPGWAELLQDAQAGLFDRVCCTYMSRLARGKAYHVADYLLSECGVKVELVREKFSPDLAGQVNQEMVVFVDGIYPKMVSQWTRTKMEQMVAQGYYCGGTIPFGYSVEPVAPAITNSDKDPSKRFVVDDAAAQTVRTAFDLLVESGSVAEVVRYLKQATNRRWTITTATHLLANEAYVGVYQFGEWRNENARPPIVDPGIWQTAQQVLNVGKRRPRQSSRCDDYTYYLRGLVRCPHCGCSYTNGAAKGGAVRYYQCLHDTKQITKCPVGRVNADALHASILREVERAATHHTVMHKLIADSGGWDSASDAQMALRGQLAKKRQFNAVQIDNLTRAIGEGRSLETLLDALEKREKERDEINRQLVEIEMQIALSTVKRPQAAEIQQVWSRLRDLWEDSSEEDRAAIMQGVVREVVVQEKNFVSLTLAPIPDIHEAKFEIEYSLGAGRGFEPLTFGL